MTGESTRARDATESRTDVEDGVEGDPDVEVVLVAAVAANGVIGVDGGMPWHLPADLKHFKRTTMGHPVVMGRRTYESIAADLDGPLPGRPNVVLSTRDPTLAGADDPDSSEVLVVESVAAALDAAAARDDEVYVVGGATVYAQFLPLADRLVLTELEASYEGDTWFPEWDREAWVERERRPNDGFDFVTYERRGR